MNSKIKVRGILAAGVLTGCFLFTSCSQCDHRNKDIKTVIEHPADGMERPSLYAMENIWQDQSGKSMRLKDLKGKIPLVSMIFTRCPYACPRTIADLKNIEKQLPEEKRGQVAFVLVSFDDINDTPEQLRAFAEKMNAGKDWILLHGNEESIRELAMVLNVKYKKQPDGNFTHSNIISLLDRNGGIEAQLEGLNADAAPLVSAIGEL